jgi:hypothetical protein
MTKSTSRITKTKSTKVQLFDQDDYKSHLLNVDKQSWLSKAIEDRTKVKFENNEIKNILDSYINAVNNFYQSSIGINNINETDTINYFITPFLNSILPKKFKTAEYRLPEQNIRLDSVIYDQSKYDINGVKNDVNSEFVFFEYKKANIFYNGNSSDIYDVAMAHGLLQKQSAKSSDDKFVLKGAQSRQMVQYLDATRLLHSGNTSAGIITNGLSYYFMIANGCDNTGCCQTWSILYTLDIAELVKEYIDTNEYLTAKIKIEAFVNLIETFMNGKKRKNFIEWYNNQYNKIKASIDIFNNDDESFENYKKAIKLFGNTNTLTTARNFRHYIGY